MALIFESLSAFVEYIRTFPNAQNVPTTEHLLSFPTIYPQEATLKDFFSASITDLGRLDFILEYQILLLLLLFRTGASSNLNT